MLDSILFASFATQAWKMNIGPESSEHFRLRQNNCMTCDEDKYNCASFIFFAPFS